ncbi:prostaglandin-H2 D-isomerase [Heteronotia binoei]|uniref:prostaglandin-H2 D-isomerase n=1 Tax=Heteronotia binoei TaxID=13085 RepID=UPI00292DA18E|nr:prostaglandin-H2 D-isomerase [Heteronotia binoei]XP_060107717.1 prostaglandin-H2 D-isomerase [Heteronotia binoei]
MQQPRLVGFLALILGCLLQTQAEVPVQPDFQQDQFLGRWYSIGLASNSRWFKEKKSVMKMCTTVVTPTEDGNLNVTSTYPKLDQCESRKSLFVPTDQPGRFSYTSLRSGSQHDVRVVETNYNEYALLSFKKNKGAETFTMVTLYGRLKVLNPELLEKFTRFALEQGLTKEDILILPRTNLCMEEYV